MAMSQPAEYVRVRPWIHSDVVWMSVLFCIIYLVVVAVWVVRVPEERCRRYAPVGAALPYLLTLPEKKNTFPSAEIRE